MSDQRDKAFVRESVDQGLSSLEGNPFLAQRVLAQVNGKEEIVVKKKISVSFVLVVVMLFLMASAALAAGLGFLGVNWFGNTDENGGYFAVASSTPMPAATDERKVSIVEKFYAVCQEVFTKAHNREYIFVSYENEQGSVVSCCPSTQDVWNLEDFKALISMNPELPVPQHLPEGYGFRSATVNFDCKADGELVLTSKETLEDGITITRYHADDTDILSAVI